MPAPQANMIRRCTAHPNATAKGTKVNSLVEQGKGPQGNACRQVREVGVAGEAIYLSMERNMKCAVAFCGHCQFGTVFVCRDGPVFRYDRVRSLLTVREI